MNKIRSIEKMCRTLTDSFFEGAPKKKICYNTMLEYMRVSNLMTSVNITLNLIEVFKRLKDENYTNDEFIGHFQCELNEAWEALRKTRIGSTTFLRMDLDTIINSSNPRDLLLKSIFGAIPEERK